MTDDPIPSTYRFERDPDVTVQYRGDGRWAVCDGASCLNTDGDFEHESMPSNRTDEFIARCRFTESEAIRRAQAMLGWRQRALAEEKAAYDAGRDGYEA